MQKNYQHAQRQTTTTKPSFWKFFAIALCILLSFGIIIRWYSKENPLPVSPAQQPSESPPTRFDFYNTLPKMKINIPESEAKENGDDAKATAHHIYLLQVGSFEQSKAAKKMLDKLASLNIQAQIEPTPINDNKVWHRVRIGPFDDLEKTHSVRQQLNRNDIDTMLVKLPIEQNHITIPADSNR